MKVEMYKNVILPVELYGYGTWYLILKEKHRPKEFKNRMLRRIFRSKRNEIIGGWRKLYNEVFSNLYTSPNTI
jgi:hypothetical protein